MGLVGLVWNKGRTRSVPAPGFDSRQLHVKLSELKTAAEIHEQDMQDPEYAAEYEKSLEEGECDEAGACYR